MGNFGRFNPFDPPHWWRSFGDELTAQVLNILSLEIIVHQKRWGIHQPHRKLPKTLSLLGPNYFVEDYGNELRSSNVLKTQWWQVISKCPWSLAALQTFTPLSGRISSCVAPHKPVAKTQSCRTKQLKITFHSAQCPSMHFLGGSGREAKVETRLSIEDHGSCHVSHVPSGPTSPFHKGPVQAAWENTTQDSKYKSKNTHQTQKPIIKTYKHPYIKHAMHLLQTQHLPIELKAPTSPQPSHGSRDSQEICLALMPVPTNGQHALPKAVLAAVLVVLS